MSKTITDPGPGGGVYDLAKVSGVKRGGTPHPDLGLGKEARAVLVLDTGAEVSTLIAYSDAVKAFTDADGAAPADAAPPAPAA